MKFNQKLLAQMRTATRALMGQGPSAATAAIQAALNGQSAGPAAEPPKPTMRDINPPPPRVEKAAKPAPLPDAPPAPAPSHTLKDLMPELMAGIDRMAGAGMTGFDMPKFDMPNFKSPLHSPSAPGAVELPGRFIDGTHTNSAGTRAYKLYVPAAYEGKPLPLLVMLHGCTQNPDDFATGTQMNAIAEEMHCLVVYPAQSQQANASRCWNWFSAVDQQRGQGEPSIIAGITQSIIESYAVDSSQVYVAGLSAGGAMAAIMGTLYPDLYAAVGVHSGLPFASADDLPSALSAMKGNFGRPRAGGSAVPIIVFHGDKDTTVHPKNGDEVIAQRTHKGSKAIVVEPGRVPDGHAYTRTVHQRADGTPLAEQWLIHGAGHAWSGGSAHGSYTDGKGPDASREMLRFFRTKR